MKFDYFSLFVNVLFLISTVTIMCFFLKQYNPPLIVYCSIGFINGILQGFLLNDHFPIYK